MMSDTPRSAQCVETEYRPPHPVDLLRVVGFHRSGPGDPSMIVDGPVIWRTSRTPEGVATLALRQASTGAIRGAAWGAGAAWAITQLPDLCGASDTAESFEPGTHPLIRRTHRRRPGLRIGRTDLVFDALAAAIIEQKVTGLQAFRAWRLLLTWHGERAPGPTPRTMFAPPSIEGWRRIPSWSWHRAGVEPSQSRTLVDAAQRGESLTRTLGAAGDNVARDRVLTSLRGVGAWTSAETRIRAFGDPDAVSVGDYHVAHEVGFALTGSRVDDERMLELLADWPGHRQRVIRLIGASGVREPRRGPRLHPEDHRER